MPKTDIETQVDATPAQRPAENPDAIARTPLLSMNALVRGVDVALRHALTGVVIAGDEVELERSFARSIFATRMA